MTSLITLIIFIIVVLIILWGFSVYNNLIALRNHGENAFAQIDVQLQRRYDLIPNLVEVAKKYMAHEKGTLEAVVQARNAAQNAAQRAGNIPGDAAAMQALMGAESALTGMLTKFFALVENYPDLKANQNMLHLQEELASTENDISYARNNYNNNIVAYNIKRESAPDNIIAGIFKFKPLKQWKIEDEQVRKAVKVNFD